MISVHESAAVHRTVPERDARQTDQIDLLGNRELRAALWQNRISFPSQIPLFHHLERGHMQVRMAQLYFLRGWTFAQIALRYGLTRASVSQIVSDWRLRAVRAGYIAQTSGE